MYTVSDYVFYIATIETYFQFYNKCQIAYMRLTSGLHFIYGLKASANGQIRKLGVAHAPGVRRTFPRHRL